MNPEAPQHLSESSRALWDNVVSRRPMSGGRLALVQTALEALDRANAASSAVNAEGMCCTTESTGAIHVHPLLKIELNNRALFSRIWTSLCLHYDINIDGRQKR